MTKSVAACSLLIVAGLLIAMTIFKPVLISDHNGFLKDFIGSNLLNVLGVILAITLASAAQLHLEFNKVEERYGKTGLEKSRRSVHGATFTLIILFFLSIVVLICKAVFVNNEYGEAACNGSELFILFCYILFLADLATAAFAIKPHITGTP